MKMKKLTSERADQIIEALEILIESKISMMREAEYENHKEVSRIKTENYEPVKTLLKNLIDLSKN